MHLLTKEYACGSSAVFAQKVCRVLFEFAQRYSESAWARVVTAKRVHRALSKFARSRSEGALTRAILAEGSLGTLRICMAPQRERLGAQDHCRGFTGHFPNSHGVAARAL